MNGQRHVDAHGILRIQNDQAMGLGNQVVNPIPPKKKKKKLAQICVPMP